MLLSVGGFSDLEQYVQEVLQRPAGGVDPIPEFPQVEPYVYLPGGRLDPFWALSDEQPGDVAAGEGGQTTLPADWQIIIFNRNKEELETFELDSLRMVGTMDRGGNFWGIIQDPEGVVHRVQLGNYMGKNNGEIVYLAEGQIELRELAQDGQGRWGERTAYLRLITDEE